jgi:hypothetical protein
MTFSKEWLIDNVVDGKPISNEIVGHGRWSVTHRCIFDFEGKYYSTSYSVGATEMQDEEPYEYATDPIECREVVKEEYTAIRYVPAKVGTP